MADKSSLVKRLGASACAGAASYFRASGRFVHFIETEGAEPC